MNGHRVLLALVLTSVPITACDKLPGLGGAKDERGAAEVLAPAPPQAPPAAVELTGMPECDEYIAAFECEMGKMDLEALPQTKASIAQMRSTYKMGASTAAGRAALAETCRSQLQSMGYNPATADCVGARARQAR